MAGGSETSNGSNAGGGSGTSGTAFQASRDNAVSLPSTFRNDNNWIVYADKLEQYFIAFKITDDNQKRAILLTSLEEEVYDKLSDLCFPDKPGSKTYKDVCGIMKTNFTKEFCVFIERLRFYEAKQTSGESVNDYVARLKKLTRYCNFSGYLKEVLRDKFVCGLARGPVFDKMCEQVSTDSFEDLVKVALKKELAVKERTAKNDLDVCKVEHERTNSKPSSAKNSNVNKSNKGGKKSCFACGDSNHLINTCKYKSYKCKSCNTTGHLAKVCKQKKDNQQKPAKQNNFIDLDEDSYLKYVDYARGAREVPNNFVDLDKESEYKRLKMKCVDVKVKNFCDDEDEKIYTKVSIGGKQYQFEVDTGSPISAVSETFYRQNFRDIPLKPFQRGLQAYNKAPIEQLGYIEFDVVVKSLLHKLRLVVIVNGGQPLIGRDFLREIKHPIVQSTVNSLECSDPDIKRLINENKQLFRKELGCYKYGKVQLELAEGTVPIFRKARAVPIAFQGEVSKQISEKVRCGILKQVDYSEWGTPLVTAPKASGGLRICGDYSVTVNPYLKPVAFALPLIEDLFSALNGGEAFSKVDLTEAYLQLELEENSQKLLAWSTQEGIFVPTRMPFGIGPACSIFQSIISKTLLGCKGAVCAMDDILVTGKNKTEHLANLNEVFKRLSDAGFTLRADKCEFFKNQVKYLGYIIDKHGLHKDQEKIKAIVDAPKPRNVTNIKSFVGLVNFYSRFFPNLSQILGPIHNLLEKGKTFEWTEECDKAFEIVKTVVASDKVLMHYDPKLPVRLICDASVYGVGAAIFHVLEDGTERPIAFASKRLSKAERNYSTPDREALSIYFGANRFAHYLLGRFFSLKTDHRPLLAIFGSKKGIPPMAAGRLQRWALYLSNFTFKIEHIKGTDNAIADFLSRFPVDDENDETPEPTFINFLSDTIIDRERVKSEAVKDTVIAQVKKFLQIGWPHDINKQDDYKPYAMKRDELTLEDGMLMWGYRVVIPESLRKRLLSDLHTAHSGIVKMKARARSYFWWPGVSQNCVPCVTNAPNPPKVPPSPWMVTEDPFERIHADFLGQIRNRMFLIITDSYSKWPEVYHMTSLTASATVNKFRNFFARFGLARLIVTDNGKQFVASEFTELSNTNGIRYMTTATYKPQSNGAAENAVKSFKSGIEKASDDPKNQSVPLDTIIERYLFFYRSSTHSTTAETPYQLLFGREMSTHFDRLRPTLMKSVKDRIEDRIKEDQNSKRPTQRHFNLGDEVMVKLFKKNKSFWHRGTIKERLGVNMYRCDRIQNRTLPTSTADNNGNPSTEQPEDHSEPNEASTIRTRSGRVYKKS